MSTATTAATIMVVEDDAAVRELLVMALEAHSLEAVAFANCTDSLNYLQSGQADLLLLDLKLGSESGVELLKAIRKLSRYAKLPVILLTGCQNRKVVLEMAHLGVQGYLLKRQFSRKELAARIDRILNKGTPGSDSTDAHVFVDYATPAAVQTNRDYERDASNQKLLQSLKPIATRAQVLEQVDRCAGLKARWPVLSKLMSVTANPNSSLQQIAEVVQMDQAVAARVLKIANSSAFGTSNVDTAQKALSRIGLSEVHQLLFSMSVVENFQTSGLGEHFSRELFWEHSIATGLIAESIARARGGDKHESDFAHTMGLLHDAARMILAEQLDDVYKRVLNTAAHMQLMLEQVETRMLMVNHAEIAERLLGAWNFPKRLIEAVSRHHLPMSEIARLEPGNLIDVATLVLSDRLAQAMLLGSSGNTCHYPTGELAQILGVDAEAIGKIEKETPTKVAGIKYSMFSPGTDTHALDYRQRLLKKLHQPIRALFLGADPAIDGYRILLDQLRDPNDIGPENIAFMHMTKGEDCHPLFDKLREHEKQAGINSLPLVVISPLANPPLDTKAMEGRDYKKMASPFALAWLVDAANSLLLNHD